MKKRKEEKLKELINNYQKNEKKGIKINKYFNIKNPKQTI